MVLASPFVDITSGGHMGKEMNRLITTIALLAGCAHAEVDPVVGAIRWDAWTGGTITRETERSLGPERYHTRLPWFAEVGDNKTVRIDGSPQEVMDQEIVWAARAGLDYWAFLTYPKENSLSAALGQYLSSSKRDQIGFSLILHNTLTLPEDEWKRERDRAVQLLREPGYQTVLGDRPLVYAFTGEEFPVGRFRDFLNEAQKHGLRPYCVFMGWHPAADIKKSKPWGFDAVSSYARPGDQENFSDQTRATEKDCWANAVYGQAPYVPIVTTGWDKTPRKDNPVSWERGSAYHKQKVFPSKATPDEIASHLTNALAFVRKHPDVCESHAIIMYAWNEYDEGGWLAPTRGADGTPDTSRLRAIGEVLTKHDDTQPGGAGQPATRAESK